MPMALSILSLIFLSFAEASTASEQKIVEQAGTAISPQTEECIGCHEIYTPACHPRHGFSIEVARKPYTCSQCHLEPDVPGMYTKKASTGISMLPKNRSGTLMQSPGLSGRILRRRPVRPAITASLYPPMGMLLPTGHMISAPGSLVSFTVIASPNQGIQQ